MKKINYQVLLEIIVAMGLIGTIAYLLHSGEYKIFLAKQMTIWLIFMALVFAAWVVGNLFFLCQGKYHYKFKHNLIILLPLIAIYGCLQATDFNKVGLPPPTKEVKETIAITTSQDQASLPINKSQDNKEDNKINPQPVPVIDKSSAPVKKSTPSTTTNNPNNEQEVPEPWYEIDHKKKIIVLNTDNYYDSILEVTAKLKKYMGYKMVIEGFVTRNDQYYDNGDFMIARMAMTCCSADIAPVGVVAFYPRGQNFPDNTWVRAEGIIVPHDFLGLPQIAIRIKSIQKIEPIPGYVYPQ